MFLLTQKLFCKEAFGLPLDPDFIAQIELFVDALRGLPQGTDAPDGRRGGRGEPGFRVSCTQTAP